MDDAPYHEGEQALQARLGLRQKMDQVGRRVIRSSMPEEHRELFSRLPWLLVASLDDTGRPWASVLTGSPGFVGSPDPRTLRVAARPLPGDMLADNLRRGAPVGLLGIELITRRRNRMNGRVSQLSAEVIEVGVDQSFGNCPKYINRKALEWRDVSGPATAPQTSRELTPRSRRIVGAADMFFIASAYLPQTDPPNADSEPRHGVDISHRGGTPGFVRIERDGSLTVPDYIGNFAFNTLGNIERDRRCGLLFIDFESGDMLQLTARAALDWDAPEIQTVAGVQRLLRVDPTEVRLLPGAFPMSAIAQDRSPHLKGIGSIVPAKATA